MTRESMEFDVVIVGAGPAGLSTACKLAQLAQANEQEVAICVVEKGSEVGAPTSEPFSTTHIATSCSLA